MSEIADLHLDDGGIETIDINDNEYDIDFLEEMKRNRKIICGGHNSDKEICKACLTIKKRG